MAQTIEALFDGRVFRPAEPVELEPNTRVQITVRAIAPAQAGAGAFLRTARSLNLEGPQDWSENLCSDGTASSSARTAKRTHSSPRQRANVQTCERANGKTGRRENGNTLRPFGLAAGEFTVPDDFDAPLSEDLLQEADEQEWDALCARTQDRLVAAARRARKQIAEGRAMPMVPPIEGAYGFIEGIDTAVQRDEEERV